MANFNGVDEIYWHRKRYTPDEIKKIQVALNQQAPLAKQIAVDGKFGKETLEALYAFQNLHGLMSDGLAGDQTLSRLGVNLGAGYALPATRKGVNQSRRTVTGHDVAMSKWANSKKVIDYLSSRQNSIDDAERYRDYLQKALPYLEPQIASRIRYMNNLGDEYDEESAHNRSAYTKQQLGLGLFKSALQSGAIRSGKYFEKDLEDWMNRYDLTTFEMQELLADPMVLQAARQGLAQHEYGQQHTQAAKAKEVKKATQNTMDLVGSMIFGTVFNPAKPVYTFATWDVKTPLLEHMGWNQQELSGLLKNKGLYSSSDNFGGHVLDMGIDILGNPLTYLTRGFNPRNAVTGAKNIMASAKNGMYGIRPQGIEQIAEKTVVNPITNKRVVINQTSTVSPMTRWPNGTPVRTVDGRFGNAGATGVSHRGLSANGNGLLLDDAMRNQTGQFMKGMSPRVRGGYTQGSYHGGRTVSRPYFETTPLEPFSFNAASLMSVGNAAVNQMVDFPVIRSTTPAYRFEKPDFKLDYSRSYGPWNTLQYMDQDADKMFSGLVTRKDGGKVQYPQYKHGGKIITKYI